MNKNRTNESNSVQKKRDSQRSSGEFSDLSGGENTSVGQWYLSKGVLAHRSYGLSEDGAPMAHVPHMAPSKVSMARTKTKLSFL